MGEETGEWEYTGKERKGKCKRREIEEGEMGRERRGERGRERRAKRRGEGRGGQRKEGRGKEGEGKEEWEVNLTF